MKTKLMKMFSVISLTAIFIGILAGFHFDIFVVHFWGSSYLRMFGSDGIYYCVG